MYWKKFATEYLAFSRRDRIAVISLVIIIAGVFLIPLPRRKKPGKTEILAAIQNESRPPGTGADGPLPFRNKDQPGKNDKRFQGKKLFYFDPNTATEEELQMLGFRPKTISIIRHYIERGGRFREPSDLKKVYGLFDDEFERLRPFVKIENSPLRTFGRQGKLPESTRNPSEQFENRAPLAGRTILKPGVSYNVSNRKNPHIIDINMADTNELKSLPGIGSRLSQRIINFREKLGGFYSVEQVGETFGLADSVFQKIKPYLVLNNREVKKINLNTATPEQLKAHPYIRYAVAGAIITYRNEHGLFKSTGDLKNIMAISHDIFQKIVPYLDVE